jgi:serine/threonine protein kinase
VTIQAGSKLGPYVIVAPLGAGGMGEVWQALDPHIWRQVAVKVPHPSLSGSEDLVRRFEQEARTAHSLAHHQGGSRRSASVSRQTVGRVDEDLGARVGIGLRQNA